MEESTIVFPTLGNLNDGLALRFWGGGNATISNKARAQYTSDVSFATLKLISYEALESIHFGISFETP